MKELTQMTMTLIFITLFAVVGISSALYLKSNDGVIEEITEVLIEDHLEDMLSLPNDSLDIDLTPSSKESK